jgi:oxaloacetate decarboxylase gamma subunit
MTPLLNAGVELMLIGMGTVFFFLTLLVMATSGMSRLVTRFVPSVISPDTPGTVADDEVAAISAAIAVHRSRNR